MTELLIAMAVVAVVVVGTAAFYAIRQLRSSTRDQLGLANSITATLLAGLAIIVSSLQLTGDESANSTQENRNTGDISISGNTGGGICAYVQGDCPSNLADPTQLSTMPVDEAEDILARIPGAAEDPSGRPPWTFLVLGTDGLGAYYRDGYTVNDNRLPNEPVVTDGQPIYVDCKARNDEWVADPSAPRKDALTTWYKVRYPEPADEGSYWVYGGYVYPLGNNGNVPDC